MEKEQLEIKRLVGLRRFFNVLKWCVFNVMEEFRKNCRIVRIEEVCGMELCL
jgi:hypothetical protein